MRNSDGVTLTDLIEMNRIFSTPYLDAIGVAATIGAREKQEDACGFATVRGNLNDADSEFFFVICDGMGGHVGGEVASNLAVTAAIEAISSAHDNDLVHGVEAATKVISDAIKQNPTFHEMGTTYISVRIAPEGLRWCSVGDSLLYVMRGGYLHRLNEDHSMSSVFFQMVRNGLMTEDQARKDPRRNALFSVVAGYPPDKIDAPVNPWPLLAGDTIILATDGIYSLSETLLFEIRSSSKTAQSMADSIVEKIVSLNLSRQDNATVIIIDPSRLGWSLKKPATEGKNFFSSAFKYIRSFFGEK